MWIKIQGQLKGSIAETNQLVQLLCKEHGGFKKWFNNKFLKWEGLADYNDEQVLNESVINCLNELSECKCE